VAGRTNIAISGDTKNNFVTFLGIAGGGASAPTFNIVRMRADK
jgi:hypothetical protein